MDSGESGPPAKARRLDKDTQRSATIGGEASAVYEHKHTSSNRGSGANGPGLAVNPSSGQHDGAPFENSHMVLFYIWYRG